jgi:hypothetical protein
LTSLFLATLFGSICGSIFYLNTKLKIQKNSPASTIIAAIGGASPKPGNGEGCIRKGIRHKILASALLF